MGLLKFQSPLSEPYFTQDFFQKFPYPHINYKDNKLIPPTKLKILKINYLIGRVLIYNNTLILPTLWFLRPRK